MGFNSLGVGAIDQGSMENYCLSGPLESFNRLRRLIARFSTA